MSELGNLALARKALSFLEKSRVKTLIVCAGARNAPIVKSLDQFKNFEVLYFFDERAAGFFALGRAKATGSPAAVITTSGTAVAELLPAVIEARYSGLPLVIVSADRPKNFRGRGAPQSIEQVGIFSHFVLTGDQHDWDYQSSNTSEIPLNSPFHLNICFSEPLFAEEAARVASPSDLDFNSAQKPLVVLGEIPARYRESILEFLLKLKAPVYAEAHSGLRGSSRLQNLLIRSGDRFLATSFFQKQFDSVLRIGSVPTTRLWRDLEDKLAHWPVLSVCDHPLSGLGRSAKSALSFQDFFGGVHERLLTQIASAENTEIHSRDSESASQLESLFAKHPNSEPAFVRRLSDELGKEARVFVGNSLPIREWDLAAAQRFFEVSGNRGVNGIDGLVSTFLGWAKPGAENVILLGDLSALYDLSALWTDSQRMTPPVKIVVMNNSGGQIFDRMFKDSRFLNTHELEFSKWAEMFGLDFTKILSSSPKEDWKRLGRDISKSIIFELCPSADATAAFWSDYEKIFA